VTGKECEFLIKGEKRRQKNVGARLTQMESGKKRKKGRAEKKSVIRDNAALAVKRSTEGKGINATVYEGEVRAQRTRTGGTEIATPSAHDGGEKAHKDNEKPEGPANTERGPEIQCETQARNKGTSTEIESTNTRKKRRKAKPTGWTLATPPSLNVGHPRMKRPSSSMSPFGTGQKHQRKRYSRGGGMAFLTRPSIPKEFSRKQKHGGEKKSHIN